uniref:Oocyst wall protein n=1 Tax=Chromera velia CCMP2878 TaxID=1169474 RepID=A0A0G4G6T6_9ALVE|mmetsp:Transcript_11161/g.21582  ORF Transcript_11161/g.21582 Transcript_11161/m.21582 type:complete len:539 (+) Transcript_11161:290-1906(+)|eukprot:Cvel_20548.t1-p1 / transcript=Cvel_20548.t1 / gene=Cvel_20548 / organism=Chromera_velia_CCMP2878 / gene_product=hypothetical protein / transcript_product=hypothetical protein / location=Cvel_scaffold1854:27411-29831(-) / protein_length=538 / sequence_SO=supercontig / SO=protein_coding / is_pseudo=false
MRVSGALACSLCLAGVAVAKPPQKASAPSCPEGFRPSGSECVRTVTVPAVAQCPDGFWRMGGTGRSTNDVSCFRYMSKAPTLVCPENFTLSGGSCARYEQARPTFVCPSPMEPDGEECIRRREGWMECPSGFVLGDDDTVCLKSLVVPPTLQCPLGFDPDFSQGLCVQVNTAPAEVACPEGFVLEGKTCTRAVSSASQPSCNTAEGFELNTASNMCEKTAAPEIRLRSVEQDIPEETFPLRTSQTCPAGFDMQASAQAGASIMCQQILSTIPWCPENFELNPTTLKCERPVFVSPEVRTYCPTGTILSDGVCKKPMQEREGVMIEEISGCPSGFSQDPFDSSSCIQMVAPQSTCPSGFEMTAGQCVRTESASPMAECPEGFELESSSSSAANKGGQADECVQKRTVSPRAVCPPGYETGDDSCRQVETAPAEHKCPSGYEPVEGACIKRVSASRSCPKGFRSPSSSADVCMRTVAAPAQMTCGDEGLFKYSPFKRVCEASDSTVPDYTCPRGYFLEAFDSRTCAREETAPLSSGHGKK